MRADGIAHALDPLAVAVEPPLRLSEVGRQLGLLPQPSRERRVSVERVEQILRTRKRATIPAKEVEAPLIAAVSPLIESRKTFVREGSSFFVEKVLPQHHEASHQLGKREI